MKIPHNPLEIPFVQLAMGDLNTGLRYKCGKLIAALDNRVDLIVQHIALAPTLELTQQRLPDNAVTVLPDKGFNREPPLWGRSNHREIADALHTHRQSSGNGCGRQCQHIDFGPERL